MAQVSTQDIADYGKYLLAQGNKPEDIKAYTDYLSSHHDVEPPSEKHWYSVTPGGIAQAFKDLIPSLPEGDPNRPWYDVSAKGTKQAFMNAVPAAGAIAGGAVAGPVGASLGATAGESLRSTVSGENPTREEFYTGLGRAAIGGAEGQMGAEMLPRVAQSVGKKILATPSELTGVPDKEIEAYSSRADKVNKIIADSKSEGKFDSQLAANHMRDNIANDVQRTRKELNGHIEQALAQAPKDEVFLVDPIKQSLSQSISSLDPVYDGDQIAKIKGVIDKIDQKSPSGKMNVQDLQKTKEYLYGIANGSYKPSSEFFQIGGDVANAAKMGGRAAKELLDTHGPEAIKNANRQLSQLHEIEDSLGASLLDKNKPPNSLYAVGAGSNPRDALALRSLGNVTGGNYMQDATDLSAARTFSDPSLLPSIKTGRALLGPAVGGSVGGAIGGVMGGMPGAYVGGKIGGGIGVALSSPAALKAAIDAGRIPMQTLRSAASALGVAGGDEATLFRALQSPQGQAAIIQFMPKEQPKMSTTIKTKNSLSK